MHFFGVIVLFVFFYAVLLRGISLECCVKSVYDIYIYICIYIYIHTHTCKGVWWGGEIAQMVKALGW